MRDSKNTIWLLYHPPMEVGRTGHVGLLIMQQEQAVYYHSMYHAALPSEARQIFKIKSPKFAELSKAVRNLFKRKLPDFNEFNKSVKVTIKAIKSATTSSLESYSVGSYENDLIMRGQSWVRMSDKKEIEDETVPRLIADLPTDPKTRKIYFDRGAYQYAIRLPDSVNARVVMEELQRISAIAKWAYLAPITRLILRDNSIYNCSSAIDEALYKGSLTPIQRCIDSRLTKVVSLFRLCYFAWLLYARPLSSHDFMTQVAILFPAVWLCISAVRNAKDFVDMNDRRMTPIGPIDTKTYRVGIAFFFLFNIAALPFTSNAADLFIFPTRLKRKAEREYGGKLFEAESVRLPSLKEKARVRFAV